MYVPVGTVIMRRRDLDIPIGWPGVAQRFFDRFIASDDLRRRGEQAEPRSTRGLADLAAKLSGNQDTDVLLLPRGFAFDRRRSV